MSTRHTPDNTWSMLQSSDQCPHESPTSKINVVSTLVNHSHILLVYSVEYSNHLTGSRLLPLIPIMNEELVISIHSKKITYPELLINIVK